MEDEWTIDANEAFTISLVSLSRSNDSDTNNAENAAEGNSLSTIASFHPKFTYPLFGDDERIFGYKGLKVNLQFNASDLRPNLSISYTKKLTSVSGMEVTDITSVMKEYLPAVAFQKTADFRQAIRSIPDTWEPPGQLVKTYNKGGEFYEVWKANLADQAVRQLVKRVQIVVLFFVEGGSYIGVDADGNDEPESSLARWSVYLLYQKKTAPGVASRPLYTFQGYSTVYDFWMFQQPTPPTTPRTGSTALSLTTESSWELPKDPLPLTDIPRRSRISQFIILPPFQGKGAGAILYDTIFELQIKDPSIKEVTIEDPNEAFDRLRDLCDLKYLRTHEPEFAHLRINPDVQVPLKGGILRNSTQVSLHGQANAGESRIIDTEALEMMRARHKIAPRQFSRLVEMHLMSLLPASVRPYKDSAEAMRSTASKSDKHVYMLWKILLKQRLYRRNSAILGEFEITERILKLDETLGNVEWEYAQILERLEQAPADANGKRKLEADPEGRLSHKKVRVET